MLPFRHLCLITPLMVTALLTLIATPSASAETTYPVSQFPQSQGQRMERKTITILNTVTDTFSCKHHPDLPWCK